MSSRVGLTHIPFHQHRGVIRFHEEKEEHHSAQIIYSFQPNIAGNRVPAVRELIYPHSLYLAACSSVRQDQGGTTSALCRHGCVVSSAGVETRLSFCWVYVKKAQLLRVPRPRSVVRPCISSETRHVEGISLIELEHKRNHHINFSTVLQRNLSLYMPLGEVGDGQ